MQVKMSALRATVGSQLCTMPYITLSIELQICAITLSVELQICAITLSVELRICAITLSLELQICAITLSAVRVPTPRYAAQRVVNE
jgi:hypothetical protein